ncbi:MAG TPA: SDR family oxidoreductase [Burkholderiaceae bacterium]|mgnify:FL=1|nr:SDR family oxidoreductase [Burkholderiaceae bacterium]
MEQAQTSGPANGALLYRSVLITGGAGGLGTAIARRLGRAGATVIVTDVAPPRIEQVVAGLQAEGVRALGVRLDVGDERDVQAGIDEVLSRTGRLDVLINNAAIDVTTSLARLETADWDRIVRTNLTGPFLLAKHASAVMREQTAGIRGQIVNIASTAAKRAWPNAVAYHATKWGLLGMSHALHAELRGDGIKVSAIVAGGMRTPFLLDRFPELDPARLQDPAHVADAVHYLLCLPAETVIPEMMVIPMTESSWP